jgi:uncharacterized membrane protein
MENIFSYVARTVDGIYAFGASRAMPNEECAALRDKLTSSEFRQNYMIVNFCVKLVDFILCFLAWASIFRDPFGLTGNGR